MTRLQRKCLVVSLCFHGVIMGALVVTAAFRSEPVVTGETVLTLISPNIVDKAGVGGERGAPPRSVQPAPVAPTPVAPAPAPAPPAPRIRPSPSPTPPVVHPLPTETSPALRSAEPTKTSRLSSPRQTKEDTKVATAKSSETAPKHVITPDLTPSSSAGRAASRNATSAASAAASAAAAQAEKNRLQEIRNALSEMASIDSKEPASKVVPLPGLDGGESFANYGTAIISLYYHAWTPGEVTSKNAVVNVKIVVARDGSIISVEFVSKSGDAAYDRSVQRALDAIKSLPPFPASTTDAQRGFLMRFTPELKESAG